MSPRTQESYVGAVYYLAKHYRKAPDLLSDEELKNYLFHIADKGLAPNTLNQRVSALRCFYKLTLRRSVDFLKEVLPRSRKGVRLPQAFSQEEIQDLLTVGCPHPKSRAFLMTLYGAGLRLEEACHLKFEHLNRKRMQIRVQQGKGRKYGKVVVIERCSSKALQRQGSVQPELSITTGCRGSEGPRRLAETESWQFVAGELLPVPAFSSPNWLRHRGGWF